MRLSSCAKMPLLPAASSASKIPLPGVPSCPARTLCCFTTNRGPPRRGLLFSNIRSEEHTSELQSRGHLVCRLLLEKKKKKQTAASNLELDIYTTSDATLCLV